MMNTHRQSSMLFRICCIALTVTAMTFAIRAGILTQLSSEFSLSDNQLGWVNAMAFLGFPVATLFGGLVYNSLGAKKLLIIAFSCHLLGLLLTLSAEGFYGLLISTFFIGFANGAVEAGCNPLIAAAYPDKKTIMLNRFHVWFPGGIVIGALASQLLTQLGFGWQTQIAIMLVPTLVYGILTFRQVFPPIPEQQVSTRRNVSALISPLFIFMAICMTLTATTELGTQQWIERILGASGASPMLIMALITGIMALGRYFSAFLVNTLNPVGLLLGSALVASLGIYSMSWATGGYVYVAAILFALGVTYFWPTMLGFVAEQMPQTGALGLAVMGGIGMFGVSIWNPIIGSWIDTARESASQLSSNPELAAGQSVLANLSIFPALLVVAFSVLLLYMRKLNAKTTLPAENEPQTNHGEDYAA